MLDGKIGRWGGALGARTKIEGAASITKNKGHYMLKASITATQAHKLEELAKRVPATEEARTRADMGIRPFAKGDDAYIARHQGQTTDTIKVAHNRRLTYEGHAYMQERQSAPGYSPEEAAAATTMLRQDELVDPFMPEPARRRALCADGS